ncbi:hypothetical protein O6H91_19G029300 [Diphasiastrum complanatum]|uniref:Uncharacterized protein n=1 Tax=Diphasiastrum complanatum TaxID=34168 RepID=A0ACC2ATS4_DIPCM|nr:hypothetical protein O6H91_19G029300 [Diphasiastrum complanatum]
MSCVFNNRTLDQLQVESAKSAKIQTQENVHCRALEKNERRKEIRTNRSIQKLRKVKESVDSLLSATENAVKVLQDVSCFLLILGPHTRRPSGLYELSIQCKFSTETAVKSTTGQALDSIAEPCIKTTFLARKIVRELISAGACGSSIGTTKLFLLIRADARSTTPEGFIPKRNYTCKKRQVLPFVISIIPGPEDEEIGGRVMESVASLNIHNDGEKDLTWFQCQHNVKGIRYEAANK